jgi:hypothetical protein
VHEREIAAETDRRKNREAHPCGQSRLAARSGLARGEEDSDQRTRNSRKLP